MKKSKLLDYVASPIIMRQKRKKWKKKIGFLKKVIKVIIRRS